MIFAAEDDDIVKLLKISELATIINSITTSCGIQRQAANVTPISKKELEPCKYMSVE